MLGDAVLFITSGASVDFHSCTTSRDIISGAKATVLLYQIKEVLTGLHLWRKALKGRDSSHLNRNLAKSRMLMKCREQLTGKGQVTLRALEDIVHAGRWNGLEDITLC